jgi:hypothetical protein
VEVIAEDFKPYSTRIETPYGVWRAIARNEISGQEALFRHQFKVFGDFEPMLRWDELFGSAPPAPAETTERGRRKTNMLLLLIPWIAIWVAIAIHAAVGGAVGIAAAALLPPAWLIYRPTLYERISVPAVAGLSLAAMFGAGVRVVVSLSYGLFGLMWFLSAFAKTPLTAYYSANAYGGENAFNNPLFMRTNRILTAAWGVLYLLTPVWTYVLMGTDLSVYTGLINSAIPVGMGVFTYWFQRWYPKKWAAK